MRNIGNGIFDELTEKMQTHPFCNSKTKSCQTGESILVYDVKTTDCNLEFLKSINFMEIKGEQIRKKIQIPSMGKSAKTGRVIQADTIRTQLF